jgi:hypothetical protein
VKGASYMPVTRNPFFWTSPCRWEGRYHQATWHMVIDKSIILLILYQGSLLLIIDIGKKNNLLDQIISPPKKKKKNGFLFLFFITQKFEVDFKEF